MFSANKEWAFVILTCFFELCWVFGFTTASQWWHWVIVILIIIVDFTFLTNACKTIPTGTVYAIFSGVGAIGSLAIDMVVFGKEIKLIEILFVALIIIGVVQLKRADS
ncbi:QacE family quaternary ammonium compound efflux SMR transporter [Gilliamella sp. B14448G11]|uniref:DMT family transporter n=1 Tax=Gilliamella TaxID=1193503 RepID=UPI0018DDE182|nr:MULTISPECIES: SMR family transporter [unclassified Gilliamella]MBI0028278.1 QacE family quaternary ammonium compound efflux SMR transporter [Gilliamella sp. B14448G7]MBI0030973.1 QacE family quaternary ammonium compound efflux SMR transporter [Gilliamella sp. B14384G15]MBI0035131.1 QacE family quaternary ammonium compound efflux SMR transporter [Gilliamella sp. B14448G11]MBI0042391.1 QacE family quaternary ammonium compound efflux SMR transporter [Gilliamella sp. B14448G12]MBI0058276.1 QacE